MNVTIAGGRTGGGVDIPIRERKKAGRRFTVAVSIEESIHRLRGDKTAGKTSGRGKNNGKGRRRRPAGRGNRENRKQLSLVYVPKRGLARARNLRVRKMHASMAAAAGRY